MALFYIASETLRQVGTQRYDPGLAELGIPDQQRVLDEICVGQLETRHFSDPQAEPVEQSEHRLVNQPSMPRPRSFRQTPRHCKQAPRSGEIEQVRNTGAGDTARDR